MRELFAYTMAELKNMSLEELHRHHRDAQEYYGDSDPYYAVTNLAYEIENRRLQQIDKLAREARKLEAESRIAANPPDGILEELRRDESEESSHPV